MVIEETVPRRLRQAGRSRDVVALVKQYMSDDRLSQPPLIVWPQSALGITEAFWQTVNSTNLVVQQSLEEERQSDLEKLAKAMSQDFPHLGRAVTYYHGLWNPNRRRKPFQRLQFIADGPPPPNGVAHVQLGERPLPPRPHALQVVYHHGPRR